MKYLFSHFIIFAFSIVVYSCSGESSSVGPKQVTKTPYEMKWTVDTISSSDPSSIQVCIYNILALSTNDIWAAGWDSRGKTWHYDGKSWTEKSPPKLNPFDIIGKSGKDLWAGGYTNDNNGVFYSGFSHYDGIQWTSYPYYDIEGAIIDLYMDPDGNMWACGERGAIFKYENGRWLPDTINVHNFGNVNFNIRSMAFYNNKMYLIGSEYNSINTKDYLIVGTFKNWKIIDSVDYKKDGSRPRWGNRKLGVFNSNKMYSVGDLGIWEMAEGKWVESILVGSPIQSISGMNSSYIIAAGQNGNVLFNSGNKWENFLSVLPGANSEVLFQDVWTDGTQIIVAGYSLIDGVIKTRIWSGK